MPRRPTPSVFLFWTDYLEGIAASDAIPRKG